MGIRVTQAPQVEVTGMLAYSLPLCTNLMVTTLIVGRIWYMSRDATIYGLQRSYTRKAAMIIIESGALYFAVQLMFVVMFGLDYPVEVLAVGLAVPVYVSQYFHLYEKCLLISPLVFTIFRGSRQR